MTKVGILGGAFNPPTIGHVELAQFVLDNTDVNEVWLVPCYGHMYGKNMVDPYHRLAMCKLAVNGNVRVFDYEIRNKMSGSSVDFVETLVDDPELDVEISLIIGQDNANTFHKWKRAEDLKNLVRFIVVGRGGYEVRQDWYMSNPHVYLPKDSEPCSSTQIREHIKENGYTPHKYLDSKVLDYIIKYRLYSYNNEA